MNWKLMYSKKYRYERLLLEVKTKEIKKDADNKPKEVKN
jgi:hypothetical protein